MKNCYEVLQIVPNAPAQEIKDTFRLLLFRYHPDHNKDRPEWAVQKTMELVEAYHVLADPLRRAHHDVLRTIRIREAEERKGGLGGLFVKTSDRSKEAAGIFRLGVNAFRTEEYEQAVQAFRKVYNLDPEFPGVRFNLGMAFIALERYSEALQWLQDQVAKKKDDAEARALHGKIASLMHKRKAAAKSA